MFTDDNKNSALKVGIDNVHYELLPNDKYNLLEEKLKSNEAIAFVGAGINDAPTLALSHIGISMDGIKSSSAIEVSDVLIMTDKLNKINKIIEISKYYSKLFSHKKISRKI